MIITKINAEIINGKDIYLHDDIISNLSYDSLKKNLVVHLNKDNNINSKYIISFSGVAGFEMTSCDFWGPSVHVFDFISLRQNDQKMLSKLISKAREYDFVYIDFNNCFEVLFEFSSGDTLRIVCQSIEFKPIV